MVACLLSDAGEIIMIAISAVFSLAQLIVVSMISYSAHKERQIQENWFYDRIKKLYTDAGAFIKVSFCYLSHYMSHSL